MDPERRVLTPVQRAVSIHYLNAEMALCRFRLSAKALNPGLTEQKFLVAQLLDRVAQPRGLLKLEFPGCLAHRRLEL